MKKKITAVLLCVALLVMSSVNISAETADVLTFDNNSESSKSSNLTQITDDISTELISQDEMVSTLSATDGIISGAVYRIRNIGNNKYMNVHYGIDADGTNIYQWTADGSTEQKFRVVYFSDSDTYKLYAMCSSNRVVGVARGGSSLASGQNVHLYTANDATAQGFKIVSLGQSQFNIVMKENPNLYLTSYGDSNGTAGGTTSTSAGNIYIANCEYTMYQFWTFELVENPPNPTGNFEGVSASGMEGWAYQTGMPDLPIQVHIYVKNDSTGEVVGYATFADQYRADLYAAGKGDGYHAFDYSMNWCSYPSGTYTVSVYGINAYGGTNPHLANSPRTFTVRKATGAVDSLSSTGVSGWAFKPDAINSSIQVHLYIRRLNGETVLAKPTIANIYRPDVYAAGYGTGNYGYSIPIDWSTLPQEELRVTLYAVDGSGENPAFYDGYYNNRMSIHLVGIIDNEGIDHSAWATQEVINYAKKIGATKVVKCIGATKENLIEYIHQSRFATIYTHGTQYELGWRKTTDGSTTQGSLSWRDVEAKGGGYFASTRCLLLLACSTASKEQGEYHNIASSFKNMGVQTVVAFKSKIISRVKNNKIITTRGAGLWGKVFVRELGNGKTIEMAKTIAFDEMVEDECKKLNINTSELEIMFISDPEYVNEKIFYGMNSCVILGDGNQVIKQ